MTKSQDENAGQDNAIQAPNPLNQGAHLYRAYIVDVDTDPDAPLIISVFKRGNEYPDIQARVRAIMKHEGKENDHVYVDADCTEQYEVAKDNNWVVSLVRKQRASASKNAVDREWLKMVLADETKSAEEKIAAMQQFV